MPIEADELGLEAVMLAIAGTVVGLALSAVAIGWLLSRRRGCSFRWWLVGEGLVVAIAVLVDVVVVVRTLNGEVTGWDMVWATALSLAAALITRRAMSLGSVGSTTSSGPEGDRHTPSGS